MNGPPPAPRLILPADPEPVEAAIVYCARASSPENQARGEHPERLLRYLIQHRHWSPFEMASLTLEIHATRDIARQILRHRSFSFQEFSQRYAAVPADAGVLRAARLQAEHNRQSSTECEDEGLKSWWRLVQENHWIEAHDRYRAAMARGIAREQARALLPEGLTLSRLYMAGTVRSWLHYCELRRQADTQAEHRAIAEGCWQVLRQVCPLTTAAMEGLP